MSFRRKPAGRQAKKEDDSPSPCPVDSQGHPEIAGAEQNEAGDQAIFGGGYWPEAVTAGIEVVHAAHPQRRDGRRRPEADAGGQGELQITAIKEILQQRGDEEGHGPRHGVFQNVYAMKRQRAERKHSGEAQYRQQQEERAETDGYALPELF